MTEGLTTEQKRERYVFLLLVNPNANVTNSTPYYVTCELIEDDSENNGFLVLRQIETNTTHTIYYSQMEQLLIKAIPNADETLIANNPSESQMNSLTF